MTFQPGSKFALPGKKERGQAAVEFALVAALIFLFLAGVIDIARLFVEQQAAVHAAGVGARFAVLDPSVKPCSAYPYANVATAVAADASGKLDLTTLAVDVATPASTPPAVRVAVTYTHSFFYGILKKYMSTRFSSHATMPGTRSDCANPTPTPVPPTSTNTPIPTNTPTNTPTSTPTNTPAPPDFSISITPTAQPVNHQGNPTVDYVVTLQSLNGFAGTIALSTGIDPETGWIALSLPGAVDLASGQTRQITLHANVQSSSSVGTYTITVTGSSPPLNRSVTAQLIVTDGGP